MAGKWERMGSLMAVALAFLLTLEHVRVVDGDTFDAGGERYRPTGYDTPETHRARCPAERTLGDRATARAKQLLAAGAVAVRPERRWRRDRHGRRLAEIRVGGRDIGEILIAEGLARPYSGRGPRPDWCAELGRGE